MLVASLGFGAMALGSSSDGLAVTGLSTSVSLEDCEADAGTLSGGGDACLEDGEALLTATPNGDANVPAGFSVIYVLTQGEDLVIVDAGAEPSFTVTSAGLFTIHTLVYDPTTLDITGIEFGETTGVDVLNFVAANDICASLDVPGAPFNVAEECEEVCEADAGTLSGGGDACLEDGEATLSATPNDDANVPDGYSVIYVLTQGEDLVIVNAGAEPSFTVTEAGLFTIHTLVYDENTLDLSIVEFGVTTGVDVLNLVVSEGICASLDVPGAAFNVAPECLDCDDPITLTITLDNAGSETTWTLLDSEGNVVASGGPYADGQAGTEVVEEICAEDGCYRLVVSDAGGNGINGGGYVLRDANGRRIIAADGLFAAESAMSELTPNFCLPLSNQSLIAAWCDKTDLAFANTTQVYASFQPGASGYQFWYFDPHGSYTRRVFSTTQNMRPTLLVTLPVPADLDLNVRVRALVGGVYTPFGQACVIRLNSVQPGEARNMFTDGQDVGLTLFPNPNRGEVVNLEIRGIEEQEQRVDIDVYDLYGKRVFAEQITVSGGSYLHTLRFAEGVAPGMYLVNVRVGDQLFTERMVKQ